jgi:hypothetical protein
LKLRVGLLVGASVACLGLAGTDVRAEERLDPHVLGRRAAAAAVEQPRTTITLERWQPDRRLTARDIEVTDLEGHELQVEAQQGAGGEQLRLSIPQQREFIVRPRELVSLRLPEQRTVLPGGVVRSVPQGGPPAGWFRPTIMATPLPVAWNADLRRYSTRLFLGLNPPDEASDTGLDHPIVMRLGFRGMTADPLEDVTLVEAGLEHEQEIDLHFLPTTETPVLELRSTLGSVDLAMEVLPRLELRPVSDTVPGFGLGTVAVDVVRLHPHGAPAVVGEDMEVSLEVSGGAGIEPDRVVMRGGDSSARFDLRSSTLGPVTITAMAGGLSDSRTINQQFPLAPLIATLVGGALGGYSRRFSKGAADAPARARIVEGTVVALIAYAASVLGLGWLQLPVGIAVTAAGAFLIGALAGFAGVMVIESLTRRLRAAED